MTNLNVSILLADFKNFNKQPRAKRGSFSTKLQRNIGQLSSS